MTIVSIHLAIEASKVMMKKTTISRSNANHIYSSLSHVLKEIKSEKLWYGGFNAAFDAVGIRDRELLTPALFRNIAGELFTVNKKQGKVLLGLWGYSCLKDADGNPVLKNGKKVMKPVFRIIHSWTPNLVLKILAQSIAFKQANKDTSEQVENELDSVLNKDMHDSEGSFLPQKEAEPSSDTLVLQPISLYEQTSSQLFLCPAESSLPSFK